MKTAQEAAEQLKRSCRTLYCICNAGETDDPAFLAQLERLVFECAGCGWWFEIHQSDGLNLCLRCGPEEPGTGGEPEPAEDAGT